MTLITGYLILMVLMGCLIVAVVKPLGTTTASKDARHHR